MLARYEAISQREDVRVKDAQRVGFLLTMQWLTLDPPAWSSTREHRPGEMIVRRRFRVLPPVVGSYRFTVMPPMDSSASWRQCLSLHNS